MTDQRELDTIGKNALSAIREMVAALEFDYGRLEELRNSLEAWDPIENEYASWCEENPDGAAELAELEEAAGECENREDAETCIREDPLEIQVRGDWHGLGDEDDGPTEFYILLSTGGPAVRIMGELQDGEPHRAYLQTQDWGTPWTDYYEEGAAEVLLAYCRCFCFEE